MLKSIELNGFKSFAKKETLLFDNKITAIVGPNGSGKSNAAEAFRFVLGEQGGKTMRVKKSTDLIWGGSHTIQRGSRAGVKVVLDNSDRRLNIDFGEVMIERIVFRDGTTEYSINGSKVRLKDIQDLLAGANVGSSGHHIISQGEADRVLRAGIKERREMLEDALGLKIYQLKKTETKRKLDVTEKNLEVAESRQRELAPQLRYLNKQVERLEKMRNTRKSLKDVFTVYYALEIKDIHLEEESVFESMGAPQANLMKAQERIKVLQSSIELESKMTVGVNQKVDTEVEKQRQQLVSLRSMQARLRTELGKVSGQLDMLKEFENREEVGMESVPLEEVRVVLQTVLEFLDKTDIKRAKALINDFLGDKRTTSKKQLGDKSDVATERHKLESIKRELEEQVAGQEEAISRQEFKLSELQHSVDVSKQKNTENERDLYKEKAKQKELEGVLAELERRRVDVSLRREKLQENLGEVQVLLKESLDFKDVDLAGVKFKPTSKDVERLKIQLEQYSETGSNVEVEYKEVKSHYDYLSQEVKDLKGAIIKLKELIKDLDTRMQLKFIEGIEIVSKEFNNFFATLFGGGSASIELVTIDDNLESGELLKGVEVRVSPPRKKVATLETLSGGERALASIALIFAMSQINPPPFLILDETDAALDEANSQRYASIVKQLSERSQVILITHNRATMASADTLYGVTMGNDGVSKLLSVQLTDAQQFAK